MSLSRVLLNTTAFVGASVASIWLPAAHAAGVRPGDVLDITITGFLRAEAGGGEEDDLSLDNSFARGLDFRKARRLGWNMVRRSSSKPTPTRL